MSGSGSEANEANELLNSKEANKKKSNKVGSPKRPSKSMPRTLATLDESELSQSSEDEESAPVRKDSNSSTEEKETDSPETEESDIEILDLQESAPHSGARNSVEIENMKGRAAKLASRGKEEEAIQFYFRAIRLMRLDLTAVTKRLADNPSDPKWKEQWFVVAASVAEVRTAVAILYERLGAYTKAISACKEAREVYENYPGDPEEGKSHVPQIQTGIQQMENMLARLDIAQGSFVDRKNIHEEVIQVRRQISITRNVKTREELFRKVFLLLNGALEMEMESLGETHPQVADTLQFFGILHKDRDEMAQAIKFMNKSLSILKLCLGTYHPRSAIAFRELGKMYDARRANSGDIDMAIGLYSQATSSFRECYGPKSIMVGECLNNEAVLHILQSHFDLAVEKLSDSLIAYETAKMSKNKIINTDSAQVWKNLAECYSRREEFESAHFAYNNALEIQKDARKQAEKLGAPVTEGCDDATLADTLLRLGNSTKQTHRYEDAHKTYKEALLIYRLHYTTAHRSSNGRISDALADAQDRLAHTLYCIAEVQEIRGIYEEAEALYSEALQLRLHSDAQRTQNRMNMVHCAMALAGIASCHMKNSEFEDAIAVYKESIKYLEVHGVPEGHALMKKLQDRLEKSEQGIMPNQTFCDDGDDASGDERTDITLEMDAESKRLMDEGEYDESIEVLSKALSIRRRRLTKRLKDTFVPESLPEKEDVAMTLVNYATILFQKSEMRQASALTNEAIRMYKSSGYNDDHPTVASLTEQLNKLNNLHTL